MESLWEDRLIFQCMAELQLSMRTGTAYFPGVYLGEHMDVSPPYHLLVCLGLPAIELKNYSPTPVLVLQGLGSTAIMSYHIVSATNCAASSWSATKSFSSIPSILHPRRWPAFTTFGRKYCWIPFTASTTRRTKCVSPIFALTTILTLSHGRGPTQVVMNEATLINQSGMGKPPPAFE